MSGKGVQTGAVAHAPEFHGGIITAGGQRLSIRRKGQRLHPTVMSAKSSQTGAVTYPYNFDGIPGITTGGQRLSIRGEGQGKHVAHITGEGLQ